MGSTFQISTGQVPVHMKARSGCITCKKRHIKCDETHPQCRRCTKAKRVCEGYSNWVDFATTHQGRRRGGSHWQVTISGIRSSTSRLQVERPLLEFRASASEWQAFTLYAEKADMFNGVVDKEFWRDTLLQIAVREPAIRQGVIALGNFCTHLLTGDHLRQRLECMCSACCQGAVAYSKALAIVGSQLGPDKFDIALLSCLLFIGIGMVRGDANSIVCLATSGLKMIRSDENGSTSPLMKRSVVPAFTRMLLGAVLMERNIGDMPKSEVDRVSLRLEDAETLDLQELRDTIFCLSVETMAHIRDWIDLKLAGRRERAVILEPLRLKRMHTLEAWNDQFNKWKHKNTAHSPAQTAKTQHEQAYIAAVLKCYYLCCTIWTRAVPSYSQSAFQHYTEDFEEMISVAAAVLPTTTATDHSQGKATPKPFAFDVALIPCLYFTAYRCRHPRIRRRAIELMELCCESEAGWEKTAQVALAKRIVEIEERGFDQDQDQERFQDVRFEWIEGGVFESAVQTSAALMEEVVSMINVPVSDAGSTPVGIPGPAPSMLDNICVMAYFWFDDQGNVCRRDESLDIRTGRAGPVDPKCYPAHG